jgi:hypothetical protein
MDSIENIKALNEERVLAYTSQPAIFEIDINEGIIIRHYILPSESPYHICDYVNETICEKKTTSDAVRIQWIDKGTWHKQIFSPEALELSDILHCWIDSSTTVQIISRLGRVASLLLYNNNWDVI